MEKRIPDSQARNIFLGGLAMIMIFSFDSCSRNITFLTSSVDPAARGFVHVKRDRNMNYVIQVHLSNLAGAKRLQPSKETYILWMESDQDVTKNIGRLNNETGFLSATTEVSFETVSSSKPTRIFITAEDDVSIQHPGIEVVLTTSNF